MPLPYGLTPHAFGLTTQLDAVSVRPLTLGDRDHWTRLWGLYLMFYETVLPPSQYDLNWARLFDEAEPVFGFIAEIEGRQVGLVHIVMHRSFWLDAPSCYLQDLYADVETRGTGVGRALIQHVYAVARAAGVTRVHWLTHETNTYAMRLYDRIAEKSGFVQYRTNV